MTVFLISAIGLVVLLFLLINLPFTDVFVSKKVNQLFTSIELPLHIQTIRKVLPTHVIAEGVTITGKDGDTIICAMDVDAHIKLLALLKNKVSLSQVYLGGVFVHLDNDSINTGINIGRAFSKNNKPKEEKAEGDKAYWEIDIKDAELENVSFKMLDPSIGIHISEEINDLKLTGFNLSLLNRSLIFKSIKLKTGLGGLKISPRLIPQKEKKGAPWTFGFRKVQMSELDFTFNQETDSLLLNLLVREGQIRTRETDFANKLIDADIIKLSGAEATILTGRPSESSEGSKKAAPSAFPWNIIIDETDLQKVEVSGGLYSGTETPDSASSSIISLENMHLIDTRLNKNNAEVLVKKLGFKLPNGFSLEQMKGEFASNQESSHLSLEIKTENSQSKLEGRAGESIFDMIDKPKNISNASISFQKTRISLKDIFYFKNDLKDLPGFKSLAKAPIAIDGDLGLDKAKITFSDISISQENNFMLALNGTAKGPPKLKKARAKLDFEFSAKDSTWLRTLIEELDNEGNYSALRSFSLKGSVSDSMGYSVADLVLKSNLGTMDFSGLFDFKKETFDLNTSFNDIRPGQLLKGEALGAISGSGAFSGSGFSLDSLSASILLLIDSLNYQDYQYHNASITGKLLSDSYEFNLIVDDPGLKTGLHTTIDRKDSSLMLNANATLFAQLDRLHLTEDTVSVESSITADYFKSGEVLKSEVSLQNITVKSPLEEANIHRVNAILSIDSSESHLKAESDFFNTEIHIGQSLRNFGSFLQNYRSYLSTFVDSIHSNADARISRLPTTNITGSIFYHEGLGMMIQDTAIGFDSINFSLINSVSDQSLNYAVTGKNLKYNSIEIGELKATALDSAGIVDVHLSANKNVFFENPANNILVNGHYADWESDIEFSVIDDTGKIMYNIDLVSDLDSNKFILKNPSQQIVLNSQGWEVENPILLSVNLDDNKVYPQLKMQTGNSAIHFFSNEVDGRHQYACQFDRVFLESLVRGSLLPGTPSARISGQLSYGVNEAAERNINTDLQFREIDWKDVSFGMISLRGYLNSDTAGSYELEMLTRIDSSKIEVEYYQSADGPRSLSTDFTALPLVIFQPFLEKQLSEMKGNISGDFDLSSEGEGSVNGNLNFHGASMRVNELNSKFRLPDESVQFSGNRLVFQNFHILDSLNNNLKIDGFIEIDDDWKVFTDLEIGSSGLQVMHTSGLKNESFYGNIFLDSHLSVKGPVSKPVIKGKLILARGSEVYYRYLEDLSLSESAKYVSFTSSSQDTSQVQHFTKHQTRIFESSIETTLEIDPTTRMNFSLSKWAFEIDLGITGGGALNFQMLNNNQYSLSGMYSINEGEANLKLVGWPNKAFRIADGGHIRWDGEIDNPDLKFEASNRVASSYTNPVDGQVRNLDIDVILKLSNHLSDLNVEFTIFTTDQYLMSIINTLSPEEQMRQAITILLFETIDLPGISTSSKYMTQQVNQLVAAQLNSLTKTTIQGIDISFGVNTYVQATEGGAEETKTSLSYDVKKSFADDRAQMRVSGRMNDLYNKPGASNISLTNISLEYQLDSAASRYLKVYNERSYEDVFEGEVVKTGMGITFRKRYWNIKEIWKRKKKK